jgi:hypothetical protein
MARWRFERFMHLVHPAPGNEFRLTVVEELI